MALARRHRLYVITAPDGRQYVGMTCKHVEARWEDHVAWSRQAKPWDVKPGGLGEAIRTFGADAFRFEQLASAVDEHEATQAERQLILQLGTRYPGGMNHRMARRDTSVVRDWLFVSSHARMRRAA